MMKLLLKEAFACRKNGEYQKAADLYSQVFSEHDVLMNDWDGWSYACCFIKLKQYQEALDLCRIMHVRFPFSGILNSAYAQAIYHTQFKGREEKDIKVLRKATNAILRLSPPGEFSYAAVAIFALVKKLMDTIVIDWVEAESWLNMLDPDLLNTQPGEIINEKGKKVSLASDREKWFGYMIRAKASLNKPEEVLTLLENARSQKLKWHYNNDIWFARKEAFAYLSLGNRQKAEEILRYIIIRKNDWFLLFDLSQTVMDDKEKILLMSKAALAPGKTAHKIKLYSSFYDLLLNSDKETAFLHLQMVVAVRRENNWSVSTEIVNSLAKAGVLSQTNWTTNEILKKLKPFWKQITEQHTLLYYGVVSCQKPKPRNCLKNKAASAGKTIRQATICKTEEKVALYSLWSFQSSH